MDHPEHQGAPIGHDVDRRLVSSSEAEAAQGVQCPDLIRILRVWAGRDARQHLQTGVQPGATRGSDDVRSWSILAGRFQGSYPPLEWPGTWRLLAWSARSNPSVYAVLHLG